MRRVLAVLLVLGSTLGLADCRRPPSRGRVLALGLAVFSKDAAGRQVPGQATAGFLAPGGKTWRHGTLTDPESNVFHKLLEYCPRPGECGLLSVGGTAAVLKLWRPGKEPQVLWKADFGGRFSRLRDAEVADVLGDGVPTDRRGHPRPGRRRPRPARRQGRLLREGARPRAEHLRARDRGGRPRRRRRPRDLRDAEPPERLDGTPQPGSVVRYVPARGEGRTVFADLGDRHAKEILVTDLDGDGKDELYASVEAVSGGSVEIRRYRADTAARRRGRDRRHSRPALPLSHRGGRGRRRPARDRGHGGEGGPLAAASGAPPGSETRSPATPPGSSTPRSSPISTRTAATSSTWRATSRTRCGATRGETARGRRTCSTATRERCRASPGT